MRVRVFGVNVKIRPTFTVLITFLLLCDRTGLMSVSLLAAAVHELGHFAAMCALGTLPRRVELAVSGVRIDGGRRPCRLRDEILVSGSGPAANFAAGSALYAIYAVCGAPQAGLACAVMTATAAFNLLPVTGLDGGDLLYDMLSLFCTGATVARVCAAVSGVLIAGLTAAGIVLLCEMPENPTLLIVSLYLSILMLMKRRAEKNPPFR